MRQSPREGDMKTIAAAGIVGMMVAFCACVGDEPATSPATADAGSPDGGGPLDSGGSGDTGTSTDSGSTACTDASDTSADKNNCGQCGHVCSGAFECIAGKCGNEVEEVAAGAVFACVLLHEGSVYCFGATLSGILGVEPSAADNTCSPSIACRATPQKIPGLANVKHIAAGFRHACALDASGGVKCWGRNDLGELAQATTLDHSATPLAVSFTGGNVAISQLAAGSDTTCALSTGKDVYCWGDNAQAAAGTAAGSPVTTPNLVGVFDHDVKEVRVGANAGSGAHACATRDDGTVWCWGNNQNGEAGHLGGADDGCGGYCNSTPTQAGTIASVTSLSLGPGSTCALSSGKVYCWGGNAYGELGDLSTSFTATPTLVPNLPTNTIERLTQGAWSQFGTTTNGGVWAWGAVDDGSLGDNAYTGVSCGTLKCRANGAVEEVAAFTDVAQLAYTERMGIALKKDGSVVAWGSNAYAALGHLPNATGAGDISCGADVCHPTPAAVTLP